MLTCLPSSIQSTQDLTMEFPDIQTDAGPHMIAGVLFIPLSPTGKDFIAFLRKSQTYQVKWAGRATRDAVKSLEPRTSFKVSSNLVLIHILHQTSNLLVRHGRRSFQQNQGRGRTSNWILLTCWPWCMERYEYPLLSRDLNEMFQF